MTQLTPFEAKLLDQIKIDFGYDLSLARPRYKDRTINALAKEIVLRLQSNRNRFHGDGASFKPVENC